MAREWTWGFEIGSEDYNEYDGNTVVSTWFPRRTGLYHCATGYDWYVRKMLAADKTELYIRLPQYPDSPNEAVDRMLLTCWNSDIERMVGIMTVAHTGQIKVARWEGGAWVVLATSALTLTLDTYQCIEAHIHLDNAGDFDIRVDDVDWITFPGDTLGDQTPASIRYVRWGGDGTTLGRQGHMDDLAINDTTGAVNNSWCGRGGVYPLVPSAAGDVTGLVPSALANWQCVDEVPPNTTDWVSDSVVDDYDLYQTADPTPVAGTVINLRMFATAKLSEAGAGSGALMMKTNAAEYTGTDTALDTTWRWLTKLEYQLNPVTGVRFTLAEIQALQIGVKVR